MLTVFFFNILCVYVIFSVTTAVNIVVCLLWVAGSDSSGFLAALH